MVPTDTKSLRIDSSTDEDGNSSEGINGVYGKLRVTCDDIRMKLDWKKVETSMNTKLDFIEDDVGDNKMIYNVPTVDMSLENNFGVISFFKDKTQARFKSQCGFDYSILDTYSRIKKGSIKLDGSLTALGMGDSISMPSKRTSPSKNFIDIPFGKFSKNQIYSYFKQMVVSNHPNASPRMKIYTSEIKGAYKSGFSWDSK